MLDDESEAFLAAFQEQQRAVKAAASLLRGLSVNLGGHRMHGPTQHPLAAMNRSIDAKELIALASKVRGLATDQTLELGLWESLSGLLIPCSLCGLLNWQIRNNALWPIEPCPLKIMHRFVNRWCYDQTYHVNIPSGRLAFGVCFQPFFLRPEDRAARLVKDFDNTLFRSVFAGHLWEAFGFIEVDTLTQEWDTLYAVKPDLLVLSDVDRRGRLPPHDSFLPYMARFACGDATLIEPLYQNIRDQIREEATLHTLTVRPGTYRVLVNFRAGATPKSIPVWKTTWGAKYRSRVVLQWMGKPSPQLPFNLLQERGYTYLEAHPWLKNPPDTR